MSKGVQKGTQKDVKRDSSKAAHMSARESPKRPTAMATTSQRRIKKMGGNRFIYSQLSASLTISRCVVDMAVGAFGLEE